MLTAMLHALHQLPDVVILFLILAVMTGVTVSMPLLRLHLLRMEENQDRAEAAFDGFKAIMGMIGVVLAFSLVQANANLQSVETLVGKEGTALASVDRALVRVNIPALAALRPDLAVFGTAIVTKEWPLLNAGDRSEDADQAYRRVSRGVRAMVPTDQRQQTLFTELLTQMDDLSDIREQVIAASSIALPEFFWVTTAGLLTLALVLAAMTTPHVKQGVGVAASTAAIALLLAFVVIIDRPFEGQTSVSPDPIVKALDRNSRRADWLAPAVNRS